MTATFIEMPSIPESRTGRWRTIVATPEDTLHQDPTFPEGTHKTLANTQMHRNLGHATRTIRTKCGQHVAKVPDWEDLRNAAEAVEFEVESHMSELFEEFERNVTARGDITHWARDKHEANRIIADIIKSRGIDEIVKVKSMATQETNLNEYLKDQGIHARETNLTRMIVQLTDSILGHIVVSTIYRSRSEVRDVFLGRVEDVPRDLSDDPTELTATARSHLHKKFLHAKVTVSGTNMSVTETGTVSIFEPEDNGRICLALPDTLTTLMSIEKLVPCFQNIEIFSQLLPRSATGEHMNPYTSMRTGVTPGDGPQELHLILMDNGRTEVLTDPIGRQALACIRCGSCMNIYPVHQHTSGHAYGLVYLGPIDAILTPQLTQDLDEHDPVHTLLFTSSLCGACGEVRPVKIDIPTILTHMRARTVDAKRNLVPGVQDLTMDLSTPVMSNVKLWEAANTPTKATCLFAKKGAVSALPFPAPLWTHAHDLPVTPRETFREWWKHTHEGSDANMSRTGAPATGIPLASEHDMTTNTTPKEA